MSSSLQLDEVRLGAVLAPVSAPILASGLGSMVSDTAGREWIDLMSGFGAVFLGHAHAPLVEALKAQSTSLWACGRLPVEGQDEVDALLLGVLPTRMRLAGLLSTGMEAAEFALRIAAMHTGRHEFAGLASSMHGKSGMTAAMCWQNAPLRPDNVHTLPFDGSNESALLDRLDALLGTRRVAALFIEPVQGSNGAHAVSPACLRQARDLCRRHGSLLVMDEILTGLYRTGPVFVSSALPTPPDILLFAKSMGNGFPVSGLALAEGVDVAPGAMAGSTFAGNPLALATVRATLRSMAGLPMGALVDGIARTAHECFDGLADRGIALRGAGALWYLEMDERYDARRLPAELLQAGVLATAAGRRVRLLPAANIPTPLWRDACDRIARACLAARLP